MRIWSRNTARAALAAAGCAALGAGLVPAASAQDGRMQNTGMFSVLSDNQAAAPISVPIDSSGNGFAVVGIARSGARSGARGAARSGAKAVDKGARTGGMSRAGMFALASGNQLDAPISIPLAACGNTVAFTAITSAYCGRAAKAAKGGGYHGAGYGRSTKYAGRAGGMTSAGMFSLLSGNQLATPISAPIDVCGSAASLVGIAPAACGSGAEGVNGGTPGHRPRKEDEAHQLGEPKTVEHQPGEHQPGEHKTREHRPTGHHALPSTFRVGKTREDDPCDCDCEEQPPPMEHKPPEEHKPPKPHKKHKPRKHRPTGHHKLPSTLREGEARFAGGAPVDHKLNGADPCDCECDEQPPKQPKPHKKHKPRKHRPTGHHKLPSTLRVAKPAPKPAPKPVSKPGPEDAFKQGLAKGLRSLHLGVGARVVR